MSCKNELELIQNFINNFDTNEFSSSPDYIENINPSAEQLKRAREIKARMNRKHIMARAFNDKFENENYTDDAVTISQEEIDDLLASHFCK